MRGLLRGHGEGIDGAPVWGVVDVEDGHEDVVDRFISIFLQSKRNLLTIAASAKSIHTHRVQPPFSNSRLAEQTL